MTASRLRVFVAVELPDSAKAEISKLSASIDALEVRGVRTVRREGLHLTLRFLGDTDAEDIPRITSAMEIVAAESERFNLTLAETGAFPNAAKPRILWTGVDGDLDKLSTLQGRVERALESAGLKRRRERFSPHVTIARVSDRVSAEQVSRVTAALNEGMPSPVPLRVDSIALMQSTPHPGGSVYIPIYITRLGFRGMATCAS